MALSRVQADGRVTVPRTIRDACGVRPGADILFMRAGPDRFVGVVLPPRESLLALIEEFAMPGPAPDPARLQEEIGAELAEPYLRRSAGEH